MELALSQHRQNRKNLAEIIASCRFTDCGDYPAREFSTLHIDIGRRTGKTRYINKVASNDDLCVVIISRRSASILYKDCHLMTRSDLKKCIANESCPVKTMIFVDEPALFGNLDIVYEAFDKNFDETFILLGR